MHTIELEPVRTSDQLASVRVLFGEYAVMLRELHGEICLADFERETATLPGAYAAEAGGDLLLALCDRQVAGCVALRQFRPDAGEMKRLYCRPTFRGYGIGRRLAEAIIQIAREGGYERICLDTLPVMLEARTLYDSLGFVSVPAFGPSPAPGAIFMERRLR